MMSHAHFKYRPVLAIAVLAFGLLLGNSANVLAAEAELQVPVHRSEIISLPSDLSEVIVADPEVADVFVHGQRKVSVVGKTIGSTSLRVLNSDHEVIRSVVVQVTYDIPAIRKALYQFFPYENIAVQTVNNNIALTGMVSSNAVAAKAVRIANEFLLPSEKTRPRNQSFDVERTQQNTDAGVINMLKVTSGQQVMLRVRVGEMQRNAMKQLGFNWGGFNSGQFALGTGLLKNATYPGAGALPTGVGLRENTFGALMGNITTGGSTITAMIDALEENNLFKLLAEPNLVAMSGEEAEFLAGGEFPIPISSQDDTVTIEFKEFGVSVKFLPQVLSDSRIRIAVSPEISELSEANSIKLDNITIPGLTTRRAKTTVELAPGESFMIAGLLRDQANTTINQLPGLGELPVLGALFRSTDFQRQETELVIAVTPYLVDPATGDEVRLPTDNYRASSMMEQFFYGALGQTSEKTARLSQKPSLEGPIGFMVD